MYKVKTYNEYQIRAMLQSGKMQYENFYKDELITFLKFSVEENKKSKGKQEDFIKWLEGEKQYCREMQFECCVEELDKVLDKFRSVMNEC